MYNQLIFVSLIALFFVTLSAATQGLRDNTTFLDTNKGKNNGGYQIVRRKTSKGAAPKYKGASTGKPCESSMNSFMHADKSINEDLSFESNSSDDDKDVAPLLLNFWKPVDQPSIQHNPAADSAFESWCNRNQFDTHNANVPSESKFYKMLGEPGVQVSSTAIVLAVFYEYSPKTVGRLIKRFKKDSSDYDHRDIVAALSLPWYQPEIMEAILATYPVITGEMLWYMILRGPTAENIRLMRAELDKKYIPDCTWSFYNPKYTFLISCGRYGIRADHKQFYGELIKKAKQYKFPKEIIKKIVKILKGTF
jgi:hypothetical protein